MRVPSLFACLHGLAPHCLLQNIEKTQGIYEQVDQDNIRPPPPPLEIFPSDVPTLQSFVADPINLEGGLTLLKGRANTADVLGLNSTDIVAGQYEGGLRLSGCAIDLVKTLRREIQDGRLSFRGKRVLELGCGHGLPGIFACLKGASTVHFQDFNVEVLRSLTIPNVTSNMEFARSRQARLSDAGQATAKSSQLSPELRFYSGDWADLDTILSIVRPDEADTTDVGDARIFDFSLLPERYLAIDSTWQDCSKENLHQSRNDVLKTRRKLSGSPACEKGNKTGALEGGYDIILMSETVYSVLSLPKLYTLMKKCLRPRYGVVYLAGKKQYTGAGGGTRQFKALLEDDGVLGAHLVVDFTDSSFNTKEIWKFFYRS